VDEMVTVVIVWNVIVNEYIRGGYYVPAKNRNQARAVNFTIYIV
jgi:hypothetical protein